MPQRVSDLFSQMLLKGITVAAYMEYRYIELNVGSD